MEPKKCHYRNCNNELVNRRCDAKYCSRNCKDNERKYVKRKQILLEKYKNEQMVIVNVIKLLKSHSV
jgi:hypothetical protein